MRPKTYDDFQKVVNNYFDGDKEPVIYDLKKYKKITYGEYTDESKWNFNQNTMN